VALGALAVALATPADAELAWQRADTGLARDGGWKAVAIDRSGRIAFGGGGGAWIERNGVRRALRLSRAVSDLYFDAAGVLWIAAHDGLWRFDGAGLVDRSPAPGEGARFVHRVVGKHGWLVAGTDAGPFVSADGGAHFARVDGAAPDVPAALLALREGARALELWWVARGDLWRVALSGTPDAPQTGPAQRVDMGRGAAAGAAPVDLLVETDGARRVVVLFAPRTLGLFTPAHAPAQASTGAAARASWSFWRPGLPPGAQAQRLFAAFGRVFIATDRGLVVSSDWRRGWRRASSPAGSWPIADFAALGDRGVAVSARGTLRAVPSALVSSPGSPAAPARGASAPAGASRRHDDEVARLHRRALRRFGMGAGELRALRRRALRRGWWPQLDLRVGYGGDRARSRDFDQSFVSGATRSLHDRDRERGDDWDASLSLRWDLADGVFDPEASDWLREERQWIGLRDDVLDEVDQLYFERERLWAAIAAAPDSPEAAAQRLRVRELSAGLDAWTGGGAPDPPSSTPDPAPARARRR